MGILDNIKKALAIGQADDDQKRDSKPSSQELPESFYIDTIEAERAQKDAFFRSNPYSPITDKINFDGLNYFPVDSSFRYTLSLDRADEPEPLTIGTNTGEERPFLRIGTVTFEVEGQLATLAIYQSADHDDLFVPFRDATSGEETYGAGRYLEPAALPGDEILLDFNQAYNPFCAYAEEYSCPLPPFENHLTDVAIRAGEKDYKK